MQEDLIRQATQRLPDPSKSKGLFYQVDFLDSNWDVTSVCFELTNSQSEGLQWVFTHIEDRRNIPMTQTAVKEAQVARESFEEAKRRLEAAEKQLNQKKGWEPGEDNVYIVESADLPQRFYAFYDNDIRDFELGRRFPTRKSARIAAKNLSNIMVLSQLAADLNGDWEPDWDDNDQPKYRLRFDHKKGSWTFGIFWLFQDITVFFKDYETAERACKILNNQPDLVKL